MIRINNMSIHFHANVTNGCFLQKEVFYSCTGITLATIFLLPVTHLFFYSRDYKVSSLLFSTAVFWLLVFFFSYFLLRRTTANKLHIIIKERNLEQTVINWWINWITWVRFTYKIRADWWFRYGMENENIKTNIYTTKKEIYVDEYYSADCF